MQMDWMQAAVLPQTPTTLDCFYDMVMQDAALVWEITWMARQTTSTSAPCAQPAPTTCAYLW